MKKISGIIITLALSWALPNAAMAEELVIITAKDNVEELSLEDVSRIFLGKVTRYPSGEEVVPLDLDPADPSYAEFAYEVLNKTPAQLKAYWAKRIFTGKGKPPRAIASSEDLLELVSADKRYLSYLDRNNVDHTVRWVIVLKQ